MALCALLGSSLALTSRWKSPKSQTRRYRRLQKRVEIRSGDGSIDSEAQRRKELFSTIVPVYDQLNEVLSLGYHSEWKRLCMQFSGARLGSRVLDVCCGTGDLALMLKERVGRNGQVVGLDFSPEMLSLARNREQQTPGQLPPIDWREGDAMELPFEEASFDAVTVGYGLRNVTDILVTLKELHRVLKPGGKMAVLDFNPTTNPAISTFQDVVLSSVVVPVATLVGFTKEYQYIEDSLKRFPSGHEQERLGLSAGFAQVRHYEIAGGLMGILVGQRG